MPEKIIVIGSSNTDMVVKSDKLPLPGETILGGQFYMFPGGKGANQAVAAARLGGEVVFIARTGNDVFGKQAIEQFAREGIDTSCIHIDAGHPSGVALILVDAKGENVIAVAPGANAQLTERDIDTAQVLISKAEVILLQLEIPISTVTYAIHQMQKLGKKVIINPAPAQALPEEVFRDLYLITPNETEAEILTGIQVTDEASAAKAAQALQEKGVSQVVITMGSKGAFVYNGATSRLIAAPKVEPVDTTAAGDVFNGALAVALANEQPLIAAVEFACRAAAISVTRMGAQASAPYLHEMKN
ncbi:ribokinase [Rhodocytophaga rosea]|uniref:Ribokinase n=1 Tax=Rhodocytophaga rosea TaxID=2704465 RepID=A0A6C0GMT1_9BACT|nr:ribokinase [Rhodocytophaga rosea]QHT69154.1 ribokinase [Rhodocytophaga rosea]